MTTAFSPATISCSYVVLGGLFYFLVEGPIEQQDIGVWDAHYNATLAHVRHARRRLRTCASWYPALLLHELRCAGPTFVGNW